jgi:hypothetical protein
MRIRPGRDRTGIVPNKSEPVVLSSVLRSATEQGRSNTSKEETLPAGSEEQTTVRTVRPNSKQILLWKGAQRQERSDFWTTAEVFGEALMFSKHKLQMCIFLLLIFEKCARNAGKQ